MSTDALDAHVHLWNLADGHAWLKGKAMTPLRRDHTADDLRTQTEAADVSGAILVQTLNSADETRVLLETARAHPDLVHGVVGWVDLRAADVDEQIAALTESPPGGALVGVRHLVQDEPDLQWLTRPDVGRGVRALGRAGLAFDVLVRRPQWHAAFALARSAPGTRLVLDHAGKPPLHESGWHDDWDSWVRDLARCADVSVKLSGLVTQADWSRWTTDALRPVADTLLDAFGPARVMIGSDWPVCTLAATYTQVWDTHADLVGALSPAEATAVLGGTARRVYRPRATG